MPEYIGHLINILRFRSNDFLTVVVIAIRANSVRKLWLMTLWTN